MRVTKTAKFPQLESVRNSYVKLLLQHSLIETIFQVSLQLWEKVNSPRLCINKSNSIHSLRRDYSIYMNNLWSLVKKV